MTLIKSDAQVKDEMIRNLNQSEPKLFGVIFIQDDNNPLWWNFYFGINFRGDVREFKGQAKVYDEGSDYGIDYGRVSKLWIKEQGKGGHVMFEYDRGPDYWISPEFFHEVMDEILASLETLPYYNK